MMVAWYWLILAFCVGIAFATITDEWCEWENTLTDILAWIAIIIGFVPLTFYSMFLKLTIFNPVEQKTFDDVKKTNIPPTRVFHLFGNFYFWVEPTAKKLWNKAFFLRIKNEKGA